MLKHVKTHADQMKSNVYHCQPAPVATKPEIQTHKDITHRKDLTYPCIARRKATELVAAVKTFSGPASEFHFEKKEFHIQQARQHDMDIMNMNTTGK